MLLVQRAERDIFCSIFSKSFPFDFVTFCPHKKQKFFIGGSRLDEKIDVPSKLCFPSRTILIRLPFLVFFATFVGFVGTVFPAMVKRIFKVNRRSFGRTRIRRNIDLFIGFVRVADIFYGFINGCFDSMDFCVCHTSFINSFTSFISS